MKILSENLDPKLAIKIGSKLLNKSRNQIYKSGFRKLTFSEKHMNIQCS
ncbi:MAG: hypothetical protein CM15mP86_10840 [Gammaproteobacteria bacterium]|nr:MAG: hypothetical protein CM15mP86_10840 [Gammaproteobacteria bacterium]